MPIKQREEVLTQKGQFLNPRGSVKQAYATASEMAMAEVAS